MLSFTSLLVVGVAVALAILSMIIVSLRRVVPTNETHIVQYAKRTISYGKDTNNGNTYYEWPEWLPILGMSKTVLPISNFDLDLDGYEAYDKGRLPFVVDIKAFFRISKPDIAGSRVETFGELQSQLIAIVQGAVRTILASSEIEDIMQSRSKFGDEFTKEVEQQVSAWGVEPVKNLELMDIRDSRDSSVIRNIMEKKKSLIEKESRVEVAENMRAAREAEIEAEREVQVKAQDAERVIGERTAEKEKNVGIAKEQAKQSIQEQAKITKEREMEVSKVEDVKRAEINRDVSVVKAEELKKTQVISAEGEKQKTILLAEGKLEEAKRHADGIRANGEAEAEAKKQMELAPVHAQITLAQEIGENEGYQKYLIRLREVEREETVGVEQAKALHKADVKVIANAGADVSSGMNSVMDLFTTKGGTNMAGMIEALSQSESGKALIEKFIPNQPKKPTKSKE